MTWYTHIPSPVGELLLTADETALTGLYFDNTSKPPVIAGDWIDQPDHPILKIAATQLKEYFAGKRQDFDLPLAPVGTPFQQQVWKALRGIPFGETQSYSQIARRIHKPKAVRAVGAANGANPIAIIVPCHRVIGSDGSLTGFGGGLPRKRKLLALEGKASTLFASKQG